jgi:osmoprotectant transport system permease protein
MMTYLLAHPGSIATLAGKHLVLVLTALAVAFAIALPLGLFAARHERIGSWLLGALGAIYTIPSLALLALLVEAVGLGTTPIFIALVAYAQFMLVRNVIAGVRSVDPAQLDAALGVGMSPAQITRRVVLPQALPIIIAGVRIAAVSLIALATLGGYVGASGLGTPIFIGLTLHHTSEIEAGSLAICVLAITVDASLRLLERTIRT